MKRWLSLFLVMLMILGAVGCSGKSSTQSSTSLTAGIKANKVNAGELSEKTAETEAIADFALELFRESAESDETVLLSPVSVLCALAMTANGADNNTRAQMEELFGLSIEDLNQFMYAYLRSLPSDEKYKVNIADAIWVKDDELLEVNEVFLQVNVDYYDAEIYKADFTQETVDAINEWVKENTDGMIEDILKEMSDDAIMYLVNAMAFDAEWENIYYENQVSEGVFTTENGDEREAQMMYSAENKYLEDENATGFIKYYADREYAFVALLPNEGVSVDEYIETLTGEKLLELLSNPTDALVYAAVPKFESGYDVELSDILKNMGMIDAFDIEMSDFSQMGAYDGSGEYINIGRVLHKTFISVNEMGTKAGAATAVEVDGNSAPQDPKTVHLDRPFVYMLIDCETNLPLFAGTLMDIE